MTAIILHLFYIDLWDEFKDRLMQLPINNYDLYISLCEDNDINISNEIQKDFPNATIFVFKNKGLDIGPFIKIFQYLIQNKKKYDTILKLHSKKSLHTPGIGNIWRKKMINSLIGSVEQFEYNNNYIKNTNAKMISNKDYIFVNDDSYSYLRSYFDYLITEFNLSERFKERHDWCAGSMFVSNYDILYDFFANINLNKLYDLLPEGYTGHSYPHALERIFGHIINLKNYDIIGI